jgi:hypothetical protein
LANGRHPIPNLFGGKNRHHEAMSIIELLQHVGAENVQLQNLADSLVRADLKKHDGEITFATDRSIVHDMAINRCDKVGLILWLPKDKMPDLKSQHNVKAMASPPLTPQDNAQG